MGVRTLFSVWLVAVSIAVGTCQADAEEEPALYESRDAASWAADLGATDLAARRKALYALWHLGMEARSHVKALAKALRDDDEYIRATVEKILLRFQWQRSLGTLMGASPELIEALQDERTAVRFAAVKLIWSAGPINSVPGGGPPPKALVPALQVALVDADARIRANAAASLANMLTHAVAALPSLETALGDDDPNVRMWSVRAISWIDATKGMAAILELRDDPDADVRTSVCEAAGGAPQESSGAALTALLAALGDKETAVRAAAVSSLWSLGRVEALSRLARVVREDPDVGIRARAATALGGLGDPAALKHLMAALQSEDEALLAGAAGGLSRLGPEAAVAVPRLTELLQTGSATLKQTAAMSLGMFGPYAKPALPALVAALEDENPGVRSMAASSLSGIVKFGIQSPKLHEALQRTLADEEGQVRQYSVGIVSSLGPDAREAVPALLALYARDADAQGFRSVGARQVFFALQSIGPAAREALPLLRLASVQPGDDRLAAAAALSCVSEDTQEIDAAVQVLIDALADERLRAMALYRLRQVGPRASKAVAPLRALLNADAPTHLDAAAALVRIEGERAASAVEVLSKSLGSEEAAIAMRRLSDIGPEGRALVPALLAHATDIASNERSGALGRLVAMRARGEAARQAFALARKDANAWIRTLGSRGLELLEGER